MDWCLPHTVLGMSLQLRCTLLTGSEPRPFGPWADALSTGPAGQGPLISKQRAQLGGDPDGAVPSRVCCGRHGATGRSQNISVSELGTDSPAGVSVGFQGGRALGAVCTSKGLVENCFVFKRSRNVSRSTGLGRHRLGVGPGERAAPPRVCPPRRWWTQHPPHVWLRQMGSCLEIVPRGHFSCSCPPAPPRLIPLTGPCPCEGPASA